MTPKPFHHGNLREVLLQQAEIMLRDSGVDGVSLRELARQAGVSHGAPRSHFIDRQALLDALAERGFNRFTGRVVAAMSGGGTFAEQSQRAGRAYVDFAVDEAALMELMFAAKTGESSGQVQDAAARLFQVLDDAIGTPAATVAERDARERFKLVFAAAMQGTATLIVSRRISRSQGEVIVADATNMLLASELGTTVLRTRRHD